MPEPSRARRAPREDRGTDVGAFVRLDSLDRECGRACSRWGAVASHNRAISVRVTVAADVLSLLVRQFPRDAASSSVVSV
jgi:hypothetical protein